MLRSLAKRNLKEFFLSINFKRDNLSNKISHNLILKSKISLVTNVSSTSINQIRFLSKKNDPKKQKNTKDELEEDEDYEDLESGDDDDDFISSIDTSQFRPGFKIIQKHVPSLRVDTIIASGLNVSRKKIDDNFYSGKLRLNGEKVVKKSHPVKENDRVDLIGDVDEKIGKRILKRVFLYKIFDQASKNNKSKVVLVTWKTGLFEDDAYKNIHE